jgi:hypothetical protein
VVRPRLEGTAVVEGRSRRQRDRRARSSSRSNEFDGRSLDDNRPTVSIDEFVVLFEETTGHSIACLPSPLRTSDLTNGRVKLTPLAVTRFGLRSSELASLLRKHQSSLTRWLNLGLKQEREDQRFCDRINQLDYVISNAVRECRPTKR